MADYGFVVETGVIVPDTADLRAQVEAEWREAFGADIVLTANTPQGVLVTMLTLARDATARNNAALANQINPDIAGGVFLDAIWRLTGGQRVKATNSLVTGVLLTGVAGTIIPAGVLLAVGSADGPRFASLGAVQLAVDGTASVDFQAVDTGPIAAPAGDLEFIVSGVLGWETATNPTPAVLGLPRESDVAGRRRRRDTLALQSVSMAEATLSAVFDLPGVRSAVYRENFTGATVIIDGVSLVEHSIYVAVSGGTDADIAAALLRSKSGGCDWNGDTTVNVLDPESGQTYPVKFQRPEEKQVYVRVTVRQGSETGDPVTLARSAVLAYVNGELDGEQGLVIGADVSPWEIAGAVNRGAPGLFVTSVTLSLDGSTFSAAVIPFDLDEQAQVFEGNIEITVA